MPKNTDPTPPTVVDDADFNAANADETLEQQLARAEANVGVRDVQSSTTQSNKGDVAPPPPQSKKRYICEGYTTFEIFGSTVTYRDNQILTNEREIALAFEYNVPLRELTPLR